MLLLHRVRTPNSVTNGEHYPSFKLQKIDSILIQPNQIRKTGCSYQEFETPFLPATSLTTTTFLQGAIDNFQDGISIGAMKGDGLGHLLRYYGSGFHDEGGKDLRAGREVPWNDSSQGRLIGQDGAIRLCAFDRPKRAVQEMGRHRQERQIHE